MAPIKGHPMLQRSIIWLTLQNHHLVHHLRRLAVRGAGEAEVVHLLHQGGSNASRASSSSNQSRVVDPYKYEKKIRVKQYDNLKIPNLPKSASDAKAFRNSVLNLVCKVAKVDEEPVFKLIEKCVEPKASESLNDSLPFPLLDRVLGSQLLELGENTRFAMHFQTMQESHQRKHKQPKGRQLLWIIFEKYKMERDRGVALTQSHLLNLKMQGSDIKASLTSFGKPWRSVIGLRIRHLGASCLSS